MRKILITLFTFLITNIAFSHPLYIKFNIGEAILTKAFPDSEDIEDLGTVISSDNLSNGQKNFLKVLEHLNVRQTKDLWNKLNDQSFLNPKNQFFTVDINDIYILRVFAPDGESLTISNLDGKDIDSDTSELLETVKGFTLEDFLSFYSE